MESRYTKTVLRSSAPDDLKGLGSQGMQREAWLPRQPAAAEASSTAPSCGRGLRFAESPCERVAKGLWGPA